MNNVNSKWVSEVDKPRIFYHILSIPLIWLFADYTKDPTPHQVFNTILNILFPLIGLIYSVFLIYTWTQHFKNKLLPKFKLLINSLTTNKTSIVNSEPQVKRLIDVLSEKYLESSISSLVMLVTLTDDPNSKKILWKDSKICLAAFIINIFPKLGVNKELKEIAPKYFVSKDGNPIVIDDSTWTNQKKNKISDIDEVDNKSIKNLLLLMNKAICINK